MEALSHIFFFQSVYSRACGHENMFENMQLPDLGRIDMSNQSNGTEYAGFWARVAAYIVDSAIIFAIGLLLSIAGYFAGEAGMAITGILVVLLQLLYWPVLESSVHQATYGKRLMGIQVEHADGGRTTFLRALGRNLAKIISAIPLFLGFVMAAFTGRKQGLHDMIAKCVVVRAGPSHFMKAVIASVLGLAVVIGSTVAFVYYIYLPGLMKDISGGTQDVMKAEPAMKPQPPAQPAAKVPSPSTPPAAKAPAPAASVSPAAPAGGDADFERLAGAPLTGLDKPNSTRAGPAILELSTFFSNNFWLKVYLPNIKDLALAPAPEVVVDRVLDAVGMNHYDAASTFEKNSFFRRTTLSLALTPVPHHSGMRSVYVVANTREQSVQKVEGRIRITIPVNAQVVAFTVSEAGNAKNVHGTTMTLKSVSGNDVVMQYRGPSAQFLTLRGFGKDGKPVDTESRQVLQENQSVDESFQTRFRAPVSKVEAVISAGLVARDFPFSLARGITAGLPSATTIKPVAMAADASAAPATVPPAAVPTAPAAAPATAAPTPASKPEPALKPATKALLMPSSPLEPPQTAPKSVPKPRVSQQPEPKLCIIKPVMTDSEIEICKHRP